MIVYSSKAHVALFYEKVSNVSDVYNITLIIYGPQML